MIIDFEFFSEHFFYMFGIPVCKYNIFFIVAFFCLFPFLPLCSFHQYFGVLLLWPKAPGSDLLIWYFIFPVVMLSGKAIDPAFCKAVLCKAGVC